ncbi:regulatory protein RecX [bacterium]|nr:regulatory protein RecX [bacterium]
MPVIIKLIPRRKNAWVELVPDDGPSLRLPREVLPAFVRADQTVDGTDWAKLIELAAYHELLDKALRILGRREHFHAELKRKLGQRTIDRELIARVLTECRRRDYLNDERAAEFTVRQLLTRGGVGRTRLRQELLKRGCPPDLARQSVLTHAADLDETDELMRLLNSRRRSLAARTERLRAKLFKQGVAPHRQAVELRRQLGLSVRNYLAGRGFTGDSARNAVDRFLDELIGADEAEFD